MSGVRPDDTADPGEEGRETTSEPLEALEPANEDPGDEEGADGDGAGVRQARAPWHFKLIVVGSVVYLGYRLYQGITWLGHHL
ncbi:MAG: hypothetical protein ACYCSF_03330 [Acidimicrobiales bacterium]